MMDHKRAFHEAIQEHPDDDLHRLALADWLEETGDDAQATFIRAQLQIARLDERDPTRDALEDQADDLLARHETEWAGRAGELAGEWTWRRGRIEEVTIWTDTLLAHGDELFASMPIREIHLEVSALEDLRRLADCPLLRWVESLKFVGPFLRDGPILPLLTSRYLDRLVELDLTGQGVEGPAIETLLSTGLFARLRVLELAGATAIGDRVVRMLAGVSAPHLERLSLRSTNVTAHGLRAVLETRNWPALRTLDVSLGPLFPRDQFLPEMLPRELLNTPLASQLTALSLSNIGLGVAELEVLVHSPLASRLESLDLSVCQLGEAEANVLATAANLAGLRRLRLHANQLRSKGARALASSPYLGGLVELNVGHNGIGGPGLRALLNAPTLRGLLRLNLSDNHVGASGVEALIGDNTQRRLTSLELRNANIEEEAAIMMANSAATARLRSLDLGYNNLGERGLHALTLSPHLARLCELNLDSTEIDPAGIQSLINSPRLLRLRQLSMRNSYITSNEREQLRLRFGAGTIF
jgi:uncharacterized protein (TIGR02996 family)